MGPDNAAAHGGLIRALLLAGDPESAQTALDAVPADLTDDAAIAHAESALALAAHAPDAGELAAFEAAVAANPDDHQARFDLAAAHTCAGQSYAATDHLLHHVAADRACTENTPHTQFIPMFEAVALVVPLSQPQTPPPSL